MPAMASPCGCKELHSRNRAGKAVLKLTAGAQRAAAARRCRCAEGEPRARGARGAGQLRRPPAGVRRRSEVPELPRGKGNKLFGIPTKKAARARGDAGRRDRARARPVAGRASGERQMTLTPADLNDYRGAARAARGAVAARLAHRRRHHTARLAAPLKRVLNHGRLHARD